MKMNYDRVYFILCHQNEVRLKGLIRYIFNPLCLYIVHVDAKAPPELLRTVTDLCKAHSNIVKIPSMHISWGGFSQVEVFIKAISYALLEASGWSHLVYLSEHHLPLRGEHEIARRLTLNTSFVQSTKYTEMHPEAQKDIRHRFSLHHRELTGWGMFPTGQTNVQSWVETHAYQGSNWVILAQNHCQLIIDSIEKDLEAMSLLRASVQSDELFVQILLALCGTDKGTIVNQESTFVAWPHLSGTTDLTFSEINYFEAISADFLFIRKAPDKIPERVLSYLDELAYCSHDLFEKSILEARQSPFKIFFDLKSALATPSKIPRSIELLTSRSDIKVNIISNDNTNHCPMLYLHLRKAETPDNIFIALLSENLEEFKLLICWRPAGNVTSDVIRIGAFDTYLLKARVHHLFYSREVAVSGDPNHGFLTRAEVSSYAKLNSCIEHYIGSMALFIKELHATHA